MLGELIVYMYDCVLGMPFTLHMNWKKTKEKKKRIQF